MFSGYFQGVFRVFSGCFQGVSGMFRVFSGRFSLCPLWVCPLDPSKDFLKIPTHWAACYIERRRSLQSQRNRCCSCKRPALLNSEVLKIRVPQKVVGRQPRTIPTKDLPHRVVFLGGVVCELSEPKKKAKHAPPPVLHSQC